MKPYEIYAFILCLIVFVLLTALFTVMIVCIAKQALRLICSGAEDKKIYKEYLKERQVKQASKGAGIFDAIFTVAFICLLFVVFAFSLYVHLSENKQMPQGNMPVFRVVKTASMEKKHEKNTYLQQHGLDDQIAAFDLIVTYQLPKEEDLQLYDIVVYEVDDILVVHRIVGIEEPDANHSERYFRLQGDNVGTPDRFPVRYSQMRAIYKGQRVPFIGSFVMFMQSPAGYICILLVALVMISTPIMEKKLENARKARLACILKGRATKGEMEKAVRIPPIYLVPVPRPVPIATVIPDAEIAEAEVIDNG